MSQLLNLATTYLAIFSLAQLAFKVTLLCPLPALLQVSDASLETSSSLLKQLQLVPASYTSQCEPLVDGIKKVRGHVEDVRMEGVRAKRPCLNDLQKEYCVKIKLIALD